MSYNPAHPNMAPPIYSAQPAPSPAAFNNLPPPQDYKQGYTGQLQEKQSAKGPQPYKYPPTNHPQSLQPPQAYGAGYSPHQSPHHSPRLSPQHSPNPSPRPSPQLRPQGSQQTLPQYTPQPQLPPQYAPNPQHPQQPGYAPNPQYPQQQGYAPQPQYTQQPPPSTGGPRTLHIYSSHRHGSIMDGDKKTPLYTYALHTWTNPDIILTNPVTNAEVGSAVLHNWSSKMSLTLHGQKIEMEPNGIFKSGHEMCSNAVPGARLKWERDGILTSSFKCTDQQGVMVARYEHSKWAIMKEGKLHLLSPGVSHGALMEECVLSALAELEQENRRNKAASSGASAGGGC